MLCSSNRDTRYGPSPQLARYELKASTRSVDELASVPVGGGPQPNEEIMTDQPLPLTTFSIPPCEASGLNHLFIQDGGTVYCQECYEEPPPEEG